MLSFIQTYPYVLAPFLGIIPALVWLWFWLKEDIHPEPHKMITLSFLGGMLAVVLVLPLQKLVYSLVETRGALAFALWAALEEISKFVVVYWIALRQKSNDEPEDSIIYLIVSALGFVALENTLFLIEPLRSGDFIGTIITGNLRFIGASLLHTMSSATIGIFMALSFYKRYYVRQVYLYTGIVLAIALHTAFNLFIMKESFGNVFAAFGAVWVGIIAILVLFEKVKNISN